MSENTMGTTISLPVSLQMRLDALAKRMGLEDENKALSAILDLAEITWNAKEMYGGHLFAVINGERYILARKVR